MRRRRKRSATWLPLDPSYYGESEKGVSFYDGTLTLPNTAAPGDTSVAAIPLTLDQTPEAEGDFNSLRDLVEGQEYVCDRVVGNLWCDTPGTNLRLARYLFAFCLAVLPVGDDLQDQPGIPPEDFNPFFADNTQAPWYFRRVWQLNSRSAATSPEYGELIHVGQFGGNTTLIDTMGVKRRIRKEQRLFAVAAAAVLQTSTDITSDTVRWGYDLRVLGHMVKARNASTFK